MAFNRSRKLIAGLLLLGVFVCGPISIVSFVFRTQLVRAGVHTEGRVVELRESGSSFLPVFTYRDSRGEEHKIYSTAGTYPPDYEVGETVPVLYRPDRPLDAKINDFLSVWALPVVTGIIAAIELCAALVIWFWPPHSSALSP